MKKRTNRILFSNCDDACGSDWICRLVYPEVS